jgi:hypothetical protein
VTRARIQAIEEMVKPEFYRFLENKHGNRQADFTAEE